MRLSTVNVLVSLVSLSTVLGFQTVKGINGRTDRTRLSSSMMTAQPQVRTGNPLPYSPPITDIGIREMTMDEFEAKKEAEIKALNTQVETLKQELAAASTGGLNSADSYLSGLKKAEIESLKAEIDKLKHFHGDIVPSIGMNSHDVYLGSLKKNVEIEALKADIAELKKEEKQLEQGTAISSSEKYLASLKRKAELVASVISADVAVLLQERDAAVQQLSEYQDYMAEYAIQAREEREQAVQEAKDSLNKEWAKVFRALTVVPVVFSDPVGPKSVVFSPYKVNLPGVVTRPAQYPKGIVKRWSGEA